MREWLRDMADALLRRRSLRLDVEWLTDELERMQVELDEAQRLAEARRRAVRRQTAAYERLHDEVRALRLSTGAPSWDETERHDPWANVEPLTVRPYIPLSPVATTQPTGTEEATS
jgi:hypothetical protein